LGAVHTCAGFRTPAMTSSPRAEAAGVRKAPRQEIAVGSAPAVRLALWGFAGASGLGCVVMIHTPVRLDRDPAVNERVAWRATRICGTSGCELSGSRRAWALSDRK